MPGNPNNTKPNVYIKSRIVFPSTNVLLDWNAYLDGIAVAQNIKQDRVALILFLNKIGDQIGFSHMGISPVNRHNDVIAAN